MKQQAFDEKADLDWLFITHLKSWDDTPTHQQCEVAIVYGNEDSPERVELLDRNHYQAIPYAVFTQNEQGNLVQS